MNVLYVYNYYQNPGGEDEPFAAEAALLEAEGHTVHRYSLHNDAIKGMNPLMLTSKIIWNRDSHAGISRIVRENNIDVAHFHNTFPLISPSAYYAARKAGARVVHTLHNFRLICPNSYLSREGRVCEDCVGKSLAWPGILHKCYRDSRSQSAAVAAMVTTHRWMGTWTREIDLYIALSEFTRNKFTEAGLPAHKMTVKPNFVHPDPGIGAGAGNYALFVGRLATNKGIDVLLDAWGRVGTRLPLRIVGDGPLAHRVQQEATNRDEVSYLGRQPREKVLSLMRDAAVLIFPSVWYEGFPMTILEAYASGLPVIASDLGSMASIVRHNETGLRFKPGDADGLAAQVNWFLDNPQAALAFRDNARRDFEKNYSASQNYTQIMRIYNQALGKNHLQAAGATREQYDA